MANKHNPIHLPEGILRGTAAFKEWYDAGKREGGDKFVAGVRTVIFGAKHAQPTGPKPSASKPIPRDKWPTWASLIAKQAEEGDQGVGDTVKRLTGKPGEWFKAVMAAVKLPCGCTDRQRHWNALYPY